MPECVVLRYCPDPSHQADERGTQPGSSPFRAGRFRVA
jgi:hypothetical protein